MFLKGYFYWMSATPQVLTLFLNQIQCLTAFIQDVAECLRPGGLATFIEWDYQIYTPEHIPYTSSTPTYNPSTDPPLLRDSAKDLLCSRNASPPSFTFYGRSFKQVLPQAAISPGQVTSVYLCSVTANSRISIFAKFGFQLLQNQVDFLHSDSLPDPSLTTSDADGAEQKWALEFRSVFMVSSTSFSDVLEN
jgi:hypothetical protein